MPYDLRIKENMKYLHAKVTGENTLENVRGYLLEVMAACAKSTCPNVLVEENLSGPPLNIEDVFKIASIDGMEVLRVVHYMAYVDTNPEHIPSRMKYAGAVASSHGLNIRVCATVEEGEEWLREISMGAG